MWRLIYTSTPSVRAGYYLGRLQHIFSLPFGNLSTRSFSVNRFKMTPATIAKYPEGTPFETGMLEVSKEPPHTLYYEVSGNNDGKPGGPGGGVSPSDRTYFDPEKYKIVLFDQRGCGKSSSSLEANTTWDLVADIEKLREKLKIDKWVVFGGLNFVASLCPNAPRSRERPDPTLMYIIVTERHFSSLPRSMVSRRRCWHFLYSHRTPLHREEYVAPVPEAERDDFIKAYNKLLNSNDEKVRLNAAKAWSKWE
ncbi:alpha/beta hydrolase fold domain-containing protein [Rhizoctonia solani AG-1 IA]|uniref:Alpha/beta hydrolase fold domain-containing protein n=1 Tax=Thanatephorus cucumeris (strain AG1-IA) TaxID=983506 RepID=L8X1L1_THACA|nr:alpha/beta hydrolase fold domain-containing protein [Rhizoctonia solani AG-1 IA]